VKYPGALDFMFDTTLEKARDEIVFALRKPPVSAPIREAPVEPKDAPRLPVRVQTCDLESAIDDMINRFPKTLEYLAK
jgi:hypothetical protein